VFAPLLISRTQVADAEVLRVSGDVDLATVPLLADAVRAAAADGHHLVVDLSGTSFLDCGGLHVLLEAGNAQRDAGHGFALVHGPRGEVARLFGVMAASGVDLPVYRSREAALAAVAALPAAEVGSRH